jgi:hypothetical protein
MRRTSTSTAASCSSRHPHEAIAEALEAATADHHSQRIAAAMQATTWHLEVTFDNEHIAATWKDRCSDVPIDYIRFYGPLRLSAAAFFVHKVAVPATGLDDEWAAREGFMKKVEASFNGTCVTCDTRGLVSKGVDKSSGNPDKQEWCVPCWYDRILNKHARNDDYIRFYGDGPLRLSEDPDRTRCLLGFTIKLYM